MGSQELGTLSQVNFSRSTLRLQYPFSSRLCSSHVRAPGLDRRSVPSRCAPASYRTRRCHELSLHRFGSDEIEHRVILITVNVVTTVDPSKEVW